MALSLSSGATLGSYQVGVLLGKGGMGEVWRASDTRLGRDVAIKTLPTEFSDSVDRLARFEREAKVLASLNHPNIASINNREYDILPNGRELVMVFPALQTTAAAPAAVHVHTVLNWTEELKTRVPVK